MECRFQTHALAAVVAAVFLCASTVTAGTIHVPADKPTIQAAIDAASHGHEIIVAPGVYHEKINLLGKSVILRSQQGAEHTTIDASGLGGSVVTMTTNEDMFTILDGFTITGGTGVLIGQDRYGGGLYVANSRPSIVDCVVISNTAARGGGAYIGPGGAPWFVNTAFTGNTATKSGGALYNGAADENGVASLGAVVVESTFKLNSAPHAAAVDNRATLTFFDSSFSNNTATKSGSAAVVTSNTLQLIGAELEENIGRALRVEAGGAAVIDSTLQNNADGAIVAAGVKGPVELQIQNSTFANNTAGSGGAIRADGAVQLNISGSTFDNNTAAATGGAIHTSCVAAGTPVCPEITVAESSFLNNTAGDNGGAIATGCLVAGGFADCTSTAIADSTLSGNAAGAYGGAIHNRCVQWFDPIAMKFYTYCGEVTVLRSTLAQNVAGEGGGAIANMQGSISVLGDSILCQNVPEHVLGEWEDEGGNEIASTGDVNCDGIVDVFDLLEVLAAWGECDACPADLDANGVVDIFDLLIVLANWGS